MDSDPREMRDLDAGTSLSNAPLVRELCDGKSLLGLPNPDVSLRPGETRDLDTGTSCLNPPLGLPNLNVRVTSEVPEALSLVEQDCGLGAGVLARNASPVVKVECRIEATQPVALIALIAQYYCATQRNATQSDLTKLGNQSIWR